MSVVVTYVEHLKANNSNTFFSVIGDSCEGTLISDGTEPICKLVIELLNKLNLDLLTLGNHDLYYSETVNEFIK